MTFQQTIMEHEAKAWKQATMEHEKLAMEKGMDRLAKLINILITEGRNDDVALATSNEAARNRLFAAFGI